jgi:GDPmannose 4,6-dehydratase
VARIKAGIQDILRLGNFDAKEDWGYAPEYVQAMWRMLEQDVPDDFVVSTGETHSVKEFWELAFELVGLDRRAYVRVDPGYFRPTDVDVLWGDASKARRVLGWEPRTTFRELVDLMVRADLQQRDDELHGRLVREDLDPSSGLPGRLPSVP